MSPLILLAPAGWSASGGGYPFFCGLCSWILHGFTYLRQVFVGRFVALVFRVRGQASRRYKFRRVMPGEVAGAVRRNRAKPTWVIQEVLRLAALSGDGCRKVEQLFNRLYAVRRKMTVGKSFVNYTLRKHRYEIEVLRRDIKRRPPRRVPKNHIWAIDMTGKGDIAGVVHSILGIVDHGSRKLLVLEVLYNKNAWTLLGHLFLAVGRFGIPRSVRSDNDAVFKSQVFRTILWFANIKQQFSVPGCPWMNGRIERLFGTLKGKLDCIRVDGRESLAFLLGEFRFWYNAVRPHQNLGGLTPDEAWHGANPFALAPMSVRWFEAWDGLLRGYYLRC